MKNPWRDLSKSIKRFVAHINVSFNPVCCITFKQTFTIKTVVPTFLSPLAKANNLTNRNVDAHSRLWQLGVLAHVSCSNIILCSVPFLPQPFSQMLLVTLLKYHVGFLFVLLLFLPPFCPVSWPCRYVCGCCLKVTTLERDLHSVPLFLSFLPCGISLLNPYIHNLPDYRPWKSHSVFQLLSVSLLMTSEVMSCS